MVFINDEEANAFIDKAKHDVQFQIAISNYYNN